MCNFHYAAMCMSQILKFAGFTKTQKYLESETIFFLQIKKIINYTSKAYFMAKNTFVAEAIFNCY